MKLMTGRRDSSRRLTGRSLLVAKPNQENKQNDGRPNRRNHPDRSPIMRERSPSRGIGVEIDHPTGKIGAKKHPDSVSNKGNQSLSRGAQGGRSLLVHGNLPGH